MASPRRSRSSRRDRPSIIYAKLLRQASVDKFGMKYPKAKESTMSKIRLVTLPVALLLFLAGPLFADTLTADLTVQR